MDKNHLSPCCDSNLRAIAQQSQNWSDGVALPPIEMVLACDKCGNEVVRTLGDEHVSSDFVQVMPVTPILRVVNEYINQTQKVYAQTHQGDDKGLAFLLAAEKLAVLYLLRVSIMDATDEQGYYMPKDIVQEYSDQRTDPYTYERKENTHAKKA